MSRLFLSLVVGLLVAWYVRAVYRTLKKKRGGIRWQSDPFRTALERGELFGRIQPLLGKVKSSLAILNGGACDRERLLGWAAEAFGLAYVAVTAAGALGLLADRLSLFGIGALVGCCLPAMRAKELANKANARKQRIVVELPELIGKLALLVGAGENVLRALVRCAERKPPGSHPLYDELRFALESLKSGESLAFALEEMGRRCAVPEAKAFCSALLLNAKVGGETFVPALTELSRRMWESRKATVRTIGEQASSRLTFPLAVIFLLILVLVGAPAIFLM